MALSELNYTGSGGVDWSPYFNTIISTVGLGNGESVGKCVLFPCKGMKHISITNLSGTSLDYYIYGRKDGVDTQLYFGRTGVASLDISGYDYLVGQRTGNSVLYFDITLLD